MHSGTSDQGNGAGAGERRASTALPARPAAALPLYEPSSWTRRWLDEAAERLEGRPAREILDWGIRTFTPRVAMATSFGPQTIVLMHWIAESWPETTVFYLDTDLLFPETLELRDRLQERLGIELVRVPASLGLEEQAAAFGEKLWERSPNQCCFLRKVLPLRHFLAGQHAWITGVRRGRNGFRAEARAIEWDEKNGLAKLNPLVGWSREEVWDYLRRHDLPTNRLHDEGYPSIGCRPCTVAVTDGDDPRSGRWRGFEKTECGIHGGPR